MIYLVAGLLLALSASELHGFLNRERIVYSAPTRERLVALTFDDGPHPVYTPEILRILDRYHVKATFFLVGSRAEQYPGLVREIAVRGHAIGNHSFTHPHDITADSPAGIASEIGRCGQEIERLTGRRPRLFRPPMGAVSDAVLKAAGDEGYRTILWTVSADHHDAPTPEAMAERVLRQIRPGAIILAHDGMYPMRWKDVAATPLIIEELQRRGYRFVTIPELLSATNPPHKISRTSHPTGKHAGPHARSAT